MIKIYKNGAWHPLSGQKIRVNGQWKTLTGNDRFYFNDQWHYLNEYHNWMTTAKQGEFTLILSATEPFDLYIDWGDGETETLQVNTTEINFSHFYAAPGEKKIRILKKDCSKLTALYCNGNQLTGLDITPNTALLGVGCYDNQLTELDISKSDIAFLECYDNQLTELDISKNNMLYLICDNNQLTELDISKSTRMSTLSCRGNNLTVSTVDSILHYLVEFGTGGVLSRVHLENQTPPAPPTNTIDVQILYNRGWAITVDY